MRPIHRQSSIFEAGKKASMAMGSGGLGKTISIGKKKRKEGL